MQAAGENVGAATSAGREFSKMTISRKLSLFPIPCKIHNFLLLDLQAAGIMSKKIDKMLNMLRLVVS